MRTKLNIFYGNGVSGSKMKFEEANGVSGSEFGSQLPNLSEFGLHLPNIGVFGSYLPNGVAAEKKKMVWWCGCVSDEAATEKKMEHRFLLLRFGSYIPKMF
ncbi:hypothetical protein A2U01_0046774 [Trifolium medium]|uniref:Uncharacterized protein n=1 Tax=Trifolium medium TaxID=97028 RepID=A0A392QMF2_9FABA|nr:hypothetical protein [Trifolium medium]